MKILLIGLGSMGTKYLSCLQKKGGIEIAALRTAKGALTTHTDITQFYNVPDALDYQPDGVIIANPTSLHVASALPFLEKGIKVMIEKPIAHSVDECNKLSAYKDLLIVAYGMRFLPVSTHIKDVLKKEKIFKVSFKRSFYLPKWHPYADYRDEYTAKASLGGGVIRTLSHEIDLMHYWFGVPQTVTGITDKISHLEIDTDDFAFFTAKYNDRVRVNFELDFFSPININTGEALTDKGRYWWDTKTLNFMSYTAGNVEEILEFCSEMFTEMYQAQVDDFINFINGSETKSATFDTSLQVLTLIEKLDGCRS